ncbi:MAG TPA: type II CAAX endopeptidase family protein [Planctomycetota bacterium]
MSAGIPLGSIGGVLVWPFLFGPLLLLSAIGLARTGEGAPRHGPLARLSGWDFLWVGLFLGPLVRILASWLLPADGERNLFAEGGLQVAGELFAWGFLRWRAGRVAAPQPLARAWGWTLTTYALALPGFIAVATLNHQLLAMFTDEVPRQQVLENVTEFGGLALAPVLLFVVVIAPLFEEVLFRGYLWRHLSARREFGPRRALLFSAAAFALWHERVAWLPVFYLGLLFGWVYWRTGRLDQAVFAHALHNSLAVMAGFALSK